jgi:hypothetical protein
MDKYYFSNIEGIDNLRLECIFYEFEEEPILFLCKSDENELYFCLCSEIRWGQRWILVKTQLENLRLLAEKSIDIATLFFNSEKAVIIDMDLKGKETCKLIDSKKIDRIDLPEDGIFLRCNNTDIKEYLNNSKKVITEEFIDVNYSNIYNKPQYAYPSDGDFTIHNTPIHNTPYSFKIRQSYGESILKGICDDTDNILNAS